MPGWQSSISHAAALLLTSSNLMYERLFVVLLCCCQAAAIDAAIARGEPAGPLAGVPIAIKVGTA
jgi:Asp-tRNA(Asn)/Glu-tRNA(Gln) amidotransferase A subunit family amidase